MIAFVSAVFLLLITPGPGVLSAAAVGAAFGYRSGTRYIAGLCLGNFLVGLIVISGLWALIVVVPGLRILLGLASLCYLGFLAFRVASAGTEVGFDSADNEPGIVAGVTLQLINPKAYAVNTFLFSNFALYPDAWLVEVGVKLVVYNAIWIPIHFAWMQLGIALHRMQLSPDRQRWVNWIMATSLGVVVLLATWDLLRSGA